MEHCLSVTIVHSDVSLLTPSILYKISFDTCKNWYMSYWTKWHLLRYKLFLFTSVHIDMSWNVRHSLMERVQIDICQTVRNVLWYVTKCTCVLPYKIGLWHVSKFKRRTLYKISRGTCSDGHVAFCTKFVYDSCPYWYLPYFKKKLVARAQMAKWHTAKNSLLHGSIWSRVTVYLIYCDTCANLHVL